MGATPGQLTGEYAERGDYHRHLDPNWVYYPTYVAKMRAVRGWVESLPGTPHLLDAGCGEGVLVEELAEMGHDITGLDLNCDSERVRRGSLLKMPFEADTFDAVLCLDVLEHLPLSDQRAALRELLRVLKPGGRLLISVPNLAHLSNRVRMLFRGHMRRTAKESKHPGDRGLWEWKRLVLRTGFEITRVRGLFPTVPWLWRWVRRRPKRRAWMHDALTSLLPVPGWGLGVLIEARRPAESSHHSA